MPPGIQAKLLQVIENKEFFRVGGTQNVKVNVRLVCATNIDIEQHIQNKEFRMDLFYRINDITVPMPPLRDRKDDVILLASHFQQRYEEKFSKGHRPLSQAEESALMTYHWPGNVRELESLIKRVVIFGPQEIDRHLELHREDPSESDALTGTANNAASASSLPNSYFEDKTLKEMCETITTQIERRGILLALNRHGWNRKNTAKELGISYRCLLYKIQQYELKKDSEAKA